MSKLFCPHCNNLLEEQISGPELVLRCSACKQAVEADVKDESVKTISKKILVARDTFQKYEKFLRNAPFDHANPRTYRDCECGKKIQTYVRIGTEQKLVLICECGKVTM
nr:hypothetical protein K-LCC10_0123 [Kaumoebavirus]